MNDLEALVDGCDGRSAIYGRQLDDGRELAVGEVDRSFPTGSAAKILVLLAFAHAVEAGSVDPGERVEVTASYRDARLGSGVVRHLDAALRPTLNDCATLMTIVSDNVATDLLLDALGGPDAVNAAAGRLGCTDVKITSPTVWVMPPEQFGMATPRGLAGAWELLAGPGPIGERCRTIAWRQQHREGFGRHLPFSPDLADFGLQSPLRLWAKAGAYPTVSCEAGLFQTHDATWVLSVMAEELSDWGNGSTSAGTTLRADAARAVFDAWHRK